MRTAVYEASVEDAGTPGQLLPPERFIDAQIYAFSEELSEREVPVIAPQRINDGRAAPASGANSTGRSWRYCKYRRKDAR